MAASQTVIMLLRTSGPNEKGMIEKSKRGSDQDYDLIIRWAMKMAFLFARQTSEHPALYRENILRSM